MSYLTTLLPYPSNKIFILGPDINRKFTLRVKDEEERSLQILLLLERCNLKCFNMLGIAHHECAKTKRSTTLAIKANKEVCVVFSRFKKAVRLQLL